MSGNELLEFNELTGILLKYLLRMLVNRGKFTLSFNALFWDVIGKKARCDFKKFDEITL